MNKATSKGPTLKGKFSKKQSLVKEEEEKSSGGVESVAEVEIF